MLVLTKFGIPLHAVLAVDCMNLLHPFECAFGGKPATQAPQRPQTVLSRGPDIQVVSTPHPELPSLVLMRPSEMVDLLKIDLDTSAANSASGSNSGMFTMADDLTKLILLHHYRRAFPAVDESEFVRHGQCVNTAFEADGAKPGSGVLVLGPSSSVRIAMDPHWERLGAIIIDMMVRLDGSPGARRNLIEGDGCFALFIGPAGDLQLSVFATAAGQNGPDWHVTSSVDHAIDNSMSVDFGRWVRLRAAFDGVGTATLWVDGKPVARRSDLVTALGSPGGAGVVIGNWTLADTYPLNGAVDYTAVWKLDEDAVTHRFVDRLDPGAETGWGRFLACLGPALDDPHGAVLARELAELYSLVAALVAQAPSAERQALDDAFARYAVLWQANQLDDGAFSDALRKILGLLKYLGGSDFADRLRRMAHLLDEVIGPRARDCLRGADLEAADAPWFAALALLNDGSFE